KAASPLVAAGGFPLAPDSCRRPPAGGVCRDEPGRRVMALADLSSVNVANQTLVKQFVIAPFTKRTRIFRTIAIGSSGRQIALSAPAHAPLLVGAFFEARLRSRALGRRRRGRLFRSAHLFGAIIYRFAPRHNPANGFSSRLCELPV